MRRAHSRRPLALDPARSGSAEDARRGLNSPGQQSRGGGRAAKGDRAERRRRAASPRSLVQARRVGMAYEAKSPSADRARARTGWPLIRAPTAGTMRSRSTATWAAPTRPARSTSCGSLGRPSAMQRHRRLQHLRRRDDQQHELWRGQGHARRRHRRRARSRPAIRSSPSSRRRSRASLHRPRPSSPAAKRQPRCRPRSCASAMRYYGAGNYAKAAEIYRQALAKGADANVANLRLGEALAMRRGQGRRGCGPEQGRRAQAEHRQVLAGLRPAPGLSGHRDDREASGAARRLFANPAA